MASKTLAVKELKKVDGNMTYKAKFEIHYIEGNSLPYFSATGEIRDGGRIDSCGCLHEMITEQFPEFSKYIPFHLCDNDGTPMYYYENSLYHLEQGNIEGFKSCSLFGILESDNNFNPENIGDYVRMFLNSRLDDVRKAYFNAMSELFGETEFLKSVNWTIENLKKQLP